MTPQILSYGATKSSVIRNYAIDIMKFNMLWYQGFTGEGMVIGIVDSGLDYNHPMLKDKVICGYNFSNDGNSISDYFDYNYHGTSVSALACGRYIDYRRYGVASDAKIVVGKAMNSNGKGSLTSITNAINYCIEKKVDVINCSVGSLSNSIEMEKAVRNAVAMGIPVIVASGNEGHGDPGDINEFSYPAAYDDSICVGAMNQMYEIADFSNSNEFVDFIAPGVQILTAYPHNQYALVDGTSFAAPLVSGVLLLLKQKFIKDFGRQPNEAELYGMLMRYTREIQDVNKKEQGHGFIDCSINRRKRK